MQGSGPSFTVPVELSDSVRRLKRRIQQKCSISIDDQVLVFGAKVLIDNYLVTDYGIQNGSTLNFHVRVRGGMETSSSSSNSSRGSVEASAGYSNSVDSVPESVAGVGIHDSVPVTKKRRLYKNKAGNDVLPEIARKQKATIESASISRQSNETSEYLLSILQKQRSECERKQCSKCFLNFFVTESGECDYTEAIRIFKELRYYIILLIIVNLSLILSIYSSKTAALAKAQLAAEALSLYVHLHNNESTKLQRDLLKLKIRGEAEVDVCLQVYIEASGFTMSSWRKAKKTAFTIPKKAIPTVSTLKAAASSKEQKRWDDDYIPPFSYAEAVDIFQENVPDFTREMPICALNPKKDSNFLCTAWLLRHFNLYGDKAPTSDKIKMSITHKNEVYQKYINDLKQNPKVSLNRFYELWNCLFPFSINRPWCDIPGKCPTCENIDRLRRTTTSSAVLAKLQEAHLLHRGGLFNLERKKYKDRVLEAILDDPRNPQVMSIIIDGMDNNKCRCPYLGSQNQFNGPLPQHITGVKEHGHGATFFRTMGHVNKTCNLTILCVLEMIKRWEIRNKKYPTKIYIQCDGGAENANQEFLSFLELLVAKRIAKTIYFTRLPTGHTHEVST